MRTRTSTEQLQASAVAALREAIAAIGLPEGADPHAGAGPDVVLARPDGSVMTIEVKAAALPSFDWVDKLVVDSDHIIVVADQIPNGVRERLNAEGIAWLDRRGHLRLVRDGLFIDADIPRSERSTTSRAERAPIAGRSGLAAAAALLMRPDDPMGVSEVARFASLNASSISRAMAQLADAQLAEQVGRGRYRPLVPELFWALADVWPRGRTTTGLAISDLGRRELRAIEDDTEAIGWAMAGERGGVAWGAPLVLTGDYPPLLYVPDDQAIRTALALRPATSEPSNIPTITLAVDPTGLIVSHRHRSRPDEVPLAHPLFCALDLTATSRDREALEQWNPPEGFTRVW